jgi:hypothetical protein
MRSLSVAVIVVFTKYDQFKRDVEMRLEDEGRYEKTSLDDELERMFQQHYLDRLKGSPLYVRLEGEDFVNQLAFIMLILFRNA